MRLDLPNRANDGELTALSMASLSLLRGTVLTRDAAPGLEGTGADAAAPLFWELTSIAREGSTTDGCAWEAEQMLTIDAEFHGPKCEG